MPLDDPAILAALRGSHDVEAVCRAVGATPAAFAAARDVLLRRHATLADATLTGAVGVPVTIRRDRAGIPHISAARTPDLFFGLGLAMAQDRLWQMDRLRRRALGRQAEILGPAYADSDAAHLTVGIDRIAEREASAIDDATAPLIAAFVAGINRWIEAAHDTLPIEFAVLGYAPAPFTTRDIVAIGRGIWWSLNGRIDRIAAAEAARLFPGALRGLYLTPEASENLVLPDATGTDDATGSNNWALAGARTTSGLPILCGDPHQPFWVPSSWYEFALHGPEDHAAGAGHPGLPGMWWGSNGTAAWCITNNAASTRDLYVETTDPHDGSRYRDGESWRPFETRTVEIPVRGEATRRLTVRETRRGPIVNALIPAIAEDGDPPLSLRWVGAEHIDDMRAAITLSRAHDWAAFRAALRDWSIAVFNFVYADRSGRIGYQMAGRIPMRGRIVPGFRDASEPADIWRGYLAFDDLPRSADPPRGYVASANQRIVPPDDPRGIYGAYSQGHRGVRIDQALGGTTRLDRDANVRFQNDVKNCRAERLVAPILRHLGDDAAAAPLAAVLRGWDFGYTLDSPAPTAFETFMALWQRRVLARHLPARLIDLAMQQTGLAAALLAGEVPGYFEHGTSEAARATAAEAVAALRARLGPDAADWRWERVHLAHWRHPLSAPANAAAFDIGPAPVDGGSHTVRNAGGELPPHTASSGAEYRIVVDFTAPDRFLAVQNIGNSGIPGSPHYADQFQAWLDGTYHVVHLDPAAVAAEAESTTHINPG